MCVFAYYGEGQETYELSQANGSNNGVRARPRRRHPRLLVLNAPLQLFQSTTKNKGSSFSRNQFNPEVARFRRPTLPAAVFARRMYVSCWALIPATSEVGYVNLSSRESDYVQLKRKMKGARKSRKRKRGEFKVFLFLLLNFASSRVTLSPQDPIGNQRLFTPNQSHNRPRQTQANPP